MGLHDDEPLDLKDQRALHAALHMPDAPQWWDGLPPNTRRAIMNKLLTVFFQTTKARDIGSLARSLMKAQELDMRSRQGAGPTHQNNFQVNIASSDEIVARLKQAFTFEQLKAMADADKTAPDGA